MAEHTLVLTGSRQAVVEANAAKAGVTEAQYIQAIADREADQALASLHNSWWNGLTAAQKEAVYDTESPIYAPPPIP